MYSRGHVVSYFTTARMVIAILPTGSILDAPGRRTDVSAQRSAS